MSSHLVDAYFYEKTNTILKYRMTTLQVDELKKLMDDVMEWAKKSEEMEKLHNESTGESKSAYAMVHRDFLWKTQRKIGQLWFYVCGSADLNPFEIEPTPPTE